LTTRHSIPLEFLNVKLFLKVFNFTTSFLLKHCHGAVLFKKYLLFTIYNPISLRYVPNNKVFESFHYSKSTPPKSPKRTTSPSWFWHSKTPLISRRPSFTRSMSVTVDTHSIRSPV